MVRPRQITQFISPPKEVGVSMVRPLRFTQDIFTDRALDDIYKESTGIPRRINRICEKSLMYASQQGKRLIDEHLVRYIIEHEMLGGDV